MGDLLRMTAVCKVGRRDVASVAKARLQSGRATFMASRREKSISMTRCGLGVIGLQRRHVGLARLQCLPRRELGKDQVETRPLGGARGLDLFFIADTSDRDTSALILSPQRSLPSSKR